MKYLHIMPPSQRMISGYLDMIENNFDCNEHYILFNADIPSSSSSILFYKNVQSIKYIGKGKINKYINLLKIMRRADYIIFHSFKPNYKWLIFLFFNIDLIKKSVWIIWGIDLYEYNYKKLSFRSRIKKYIEDKIKKSFKYVVTIFEPDIDVYYKKFKNNNFFCAPYGFTNDRFKQMDNLINKHNDETVDLNILVGHNGFMFNNHINTLKILNKFKFDNIRLFLPISYGNNPLYGKVSYVEALVSFVNFRYSNKVTLLRKLLPNDEYTQFLSKIDVAIFNSSRQNGLGNILQLLYMGKKVYLSKSSPLYDYFKTKKLKFLI